MTQPCPPRSLFPVGGLTLFYRGARYQQMAPLYYRNANAAILAFDITNKDSFGKVRRC